MAPTNGSPANGNHTHNDSGRSVPKPRAEWIARCKSENGDGNFSQMHYARKGLITEEMIYVAVSATNQCGYCIASHTAAARKAGMTDEMFAELIAVTGMANETNRLASGYQVEIDEKFLTAPRK